MKKKLIIGIVGFIGFHSVRKLYGSYDLYGIDSVLPHKNDIRSQRLSLISELINYHYTDIRNYEDLLHIIEKIKPSAIIYLAACTGISNSSYILNYISIPM